MKKAFIFLFLFLPFSLFAQTWTGNLSSDWNTSGNWSTGVVPSSTSVVSIPNISPPNFEPKLSGDVSISGLTLSAGSQLDINDYQLITSGSITINGTDLNPAILFNTGVNQNAIQLSMGTTSSSSSTYWGGLTVNGNLELTLKGGGTFYEGYNVGNNYNGNLFIKNIGTKVISLGHNKTVNYSGNLSILDSSISNFYAFTLQPCTVSGNFSLNKPLGGEVFLGKANQLSTIGGKINISVENDSNNRNVFNLNGIENQTNGGKISINNTINNCNINENILQLDSLSFTNYKSSSSYSLSFFYNNIVGDVYLSSTIGNAAGQNVGGNKIVGNLSLSSGGGTLTEGHTKKDSITNNFNITAEKGTVNTSYSEDSWIGGDYIINRDSTGVTTLFRSGANIGGDFTFNHSNAGATSIGAAAAITTILGKVDMNLDAQANYNFNMQKVENNTTGGKIRINKTTTNSSLTDNILKLDSFAFTNYISTSSYSYTFSNNNIDGDVLLSSSLGNAGYQYLGGNKINGDFSITCGGGNLLEGYTLKDSISGDFNLTINEGNVSTSYSQASITGGDYILNRDSTGATSLFVKGGDIGGNFIYNNIAGGNSNVGNSSSSTNIQGKVNMDLDATTAYIMNMQKIVNNTPGGKVSINKTTNSSNILNNTLILDSFAFTNYNASSSYNYFFSDNTINGIVHLSSSLGNAGDQYLGGNKITGVLSVTTGGGGLSEGYTLKDSIIGDFILNIDGTGGVVTSNSVASSISGDYTVNRTVPGVTRLFVNGGDIGGNFIYNNIAGGNSNVGNSSFSTNIQGKVNMDLDATIAYVINVQKIANNTPGGKVSINKITRSSNILNNTLILDSFAFTNYNSTNSYSYSFSDNKIDGDVRLSSSLGNTGYQYLGGNKIIGDLSVTNGGGSLSESFTLKDSITGDFNLTINGGDVSTSYSEASIIGGDYKVNRDSTGATSLFVKGGNIGGNFIYNNIAGGNSTVGNTNTVTTIQGKVNMELDAPLPYIFNMEKIENITGGGAVSINNTT
ncbi:MAG TPA: hypothetical protein VLZ83_11520, partial [Edaphocola sp.]|nr:hypothetical protein [Edaphocola sp.]